VVGDVHAMEKVVVHKTGRIEGNIETKTLVVEEGAVIEGQVKMGKGGSLKSIDGGAKPGRAPEQKKV
jgi:cytoskeletal protein CcmA (bactofilin family)